MFVPLKDDTPLRIIRFQVVTAALMALNIVIFIVTGALAGEQAAFAYALGFGVVPVELFTPGSGSVLGANPVAEPMTLITYQFLHGGWLHLLSNMAFLWVFADNVEDAFGSFGFLLFYLICGALAGLAHAVMTPSSTVPLIGASGAVSGVLGSYVLLFPRARVWILLFMKFPVPLPALWILAGWFILQFVSLFAISGEGQSVAWIAHIAGFIAGLGLTWLLRGRLWSRGSP
jgi:membrane associated rhomboid family serine protease